MLISVSEIILNEHTFNALGENQKLLPVVIIYDVFKFSVSKTYITVSVLLTVVDWCQ
jgi:hypothetical protein